MKIWYYFPHARVAQLVEHSTDTRKVLGSTPSTRTEKAKAADIVRRFCLRPK